MGIVVSLPGWNPSREGNLTELKWAGGAGMLNFDNLNMCLRECERADVGPIRLAVDHPRDVYTLLQYSGAIPANGENSFENALRRALAAHGDIPGIRGVSSVCCSASGEIDVHYDGDFDIFKKEGGMELLAKAVMVMISKGEKIAKAAISNTESFANRDQRSSWRSETSAAAASTGLNGRDHDLKQSSEFVDWREFTIAQEDAAQRIAILKSNARNACSKGTRKMPPCDPISKRQVSADSQYRLLTKSSSQSDSSSSAFTSSDLANNVPSNEKISAVALLEDEIMPLHSPVGLIGVVQYARGSVRMVVSCVFAAAGAALAAAGLILGAPILAIVGGATILTSIIVYGMYRLVRVTMYGAYTSVTFRRTDDSCTIT